MPGMKCQNYRPYKFSWASAAKQSRLELTSIDEEEQKDEELYN